MNTIQTLRRLESEINSNHVDDAPAQTNHAADEAAVLGQELARIARAEMLKHTSTDARTSRHDQHVWT
jgi:hypothetical protein